jgi:hypothetical protein
VDPRPVKQKSAPGDRDPFGGAAAGPALSAWLESAVEGALPDLVRALHAANRRLWALEDAVRADLDPATIRDHKRAIDAANLERHAAVARIDAAVDAAYGPQRTPADPDAVFDSQSVGQMADRLSVLALKVEAFRGTAREAGLRAQAGRVMRCLDRVVDALRRGDGVPQSFDEAKRYGA